MWPSQTPPSYLLANIPSATAVVTGTRIFVSDIGVAGIDVISDGTRWRPVGGHAVLYRQAASDISLVDNAVEQVGFVTALPLGLIKANDVLSLVGTVSRTLLDTDVYQIRHRLGTDATGAAGTQIKAFNLAASTGKTNASIIEYRMDSGTSITMLGRDSSESYDGTTNASVASAVTITDLTANQSYFSVNVIKTTDTLTGAAFLRGFRLEWITG